MQTQIQSTKKKLLQIKSYDQARNQSQSYFNLFSPIYSDDPDRQRFTKIFKQYQQSSTFNPKDLQLDLQESRAIGVMLGMAINDALGASTQFLPFKKEGYGLITEGFKDLRNAIKMKKIKARHGQIGIWTDDASMGIVMGYGLIINKYEFNPIKNRQMFNLWWYRGLGNGGRKRSIGLGGNISISIKQFNKFPNQPYTNQGTKDNNGNGSLMRLAPIPIVFHNDIQKASQVAQFQSLTTHNGLQAKQCSRLMTEIIINLIKRKKDQNWKQVLLKTCDNFKSEIKSVEYLAKGQMETQEMAQDQMRQYPNFLKFNKGVYDRNWNWRSEDFMYSPTRLSENSGYIGSYCMDGLAMALHVVYFNNSFKQIAVKIADQGGDCDTIGSIAGQIAGAIYGVNEEVLKLYSQMEDFKSGRYEVFLIGHCLYHKKPLQNKEKLILKKQSSGETKELQIVKNQNTNLSQLQNQNSLLSNGVKQQNDSFV